MRKFLVILTAVCVFTIGVFSVDFGYIYDDADIFEDNEEEKMERVAEEVYSDSGLLCVVVTDYGIGDMLSMLPAYAGSAVDMVMLTVDMSAREFDIYQYNAIEGESAFRISYSESENILDSILDDMVSGNYADAALMFVNMSESAFVNDSNYVVGDYDCYEYYDYSENAYDHHEHKTFSIGMILLPLIVGAVVGGISVLCVRMSYKKKVHGSTYPLSQYSNLNITDSKDNFITKNVVVTHIPDPPSHSGGGGGGFHGGGSRGGGAHMGGRKF